MAKKGLACVHPRAECATIWSTHDGKAADIPENNLQSGGMYSAIRRDATR
jgi:hypothetical protein